LVSDGEHYRLSRKTESRKEEQMKRLALLSVFTLMLASAVFAPVALAQEPGEIDVQSVTLGPDGSVTVTGTIECIEGHTYQAAVFVRQRMSGNVYNFVQVDGFGTCETTGPQAFTGTGFSDRPFHRGPAAIQPQGSLFAPDTGNQINSFGTVEAVRIR
jgi:hypothetical protein